LFKKLEYFNDFTKPTKEEKETREKIPLTPVPDVPEPRTHNLKPITKKVPVPAVPKCNKAKDPLCGW